MSYNAKKEWKKVFIEGKMAYPSEYVIRIFKGSYPRLNFDKSLFIDKKICDMGCGDGRNLVLLKQCGFEVYGVEIAKDIVSKVKSNLKGVGIDCDVKTGTNDNIPFEDEFFNYMLSWNSCYYMGEERDFNEYVKEFARILKPDAYLVLSIPKKTCFIYKDSEILNNKGYQIIRNDPFNVRNGAVLRMFKDEFEIKNVFSKYFKNFIFSSIHDDCFGFNYHWHLAVCQKK